jgi:C_GCAxxG_C_C family probable redox protein
MILEARNNSRNVAAKAREHFLSEGFNCAESVLLANMEGLGVKDGWFPRVASGFGGGIARTGQVCGAITGALLAIGWALGRDTAAQPTDDIYNVGEDLVREFISEFGTTSCKMLIDVDLSDPEEYKRAKKRGVFENRCGAFVEFCALRAAEILSEDR